jgi:hypothetical protein
VDASVSPTYQSAIPARNEAHRLLVAGSEGRGSGQRAAGSRVARSRSQPICAEGESFLTRRLHFAGKISARGDTKRIDRQRRKEILMASAATLRSPLPDAAPATGHVLERLRVDPAFQAFALLRIGFAAAPVLFGLDKFFNLMVDWEGYLAPWIQDLSPLSPVHTMYLVGVIEIVAGIVVALKPRYGGYLVAAWLTGIIVNLLTLPGYYDVALRDFGLLVGALALARLAVPFDPRFALHSRG